jgi:hypothetical protein
MVTKSPKTTVNESSKSTGGKGRGKKERGGKV